jgi:hypothetical protein
MRDKRFQFGVIVTAIWLGIMVGVVAVSARPEKLNEWGDFFAGFFAPLAFMWLVIGYMQQGDELRQSSKALQLQAEELKNSVEQQSLLVEVSRKQLDQAFEEHREHRLQAMRALQPRFVVSLKVIQQGETEYTYDLAVENVGQIARDVLLRMDQELGPTDMLRMTLMRPGDQNSTRFKIQQGTTVRAFISCMDELGNHRETSFEVRWGDRGTTHTQPHPLL